MSRLACLSPFLPHEGIDHAGGEYLLRYLEEFRKAGWEISLICPGNRQNKDLISRAPDWLTVILSPDEEGVGRFLRYWRILRTGLESTPSWRWWDDINDSASAALTSSAVIDLQWSQSIILAPPFRLRYPDKIIVGTAHDILAQSLDRARSSSRFRTRLRARLTHRIIQRNEVRAMNTCDAVYVFKSEDQASLLDLGVSVDVRTTPPYIDMPAVPPTPDPQSKLIVFTGAFWRSENSEGAQWFMERVWPYLVRRCPDVRVRFAGSRPPEWLAGISSDRVEVTGYLPDLTEAYRGAAMVIAPLLRGAGLKFKVVQAVALGYPIVGTSVAAEGIASLFGREAVDVNDDPVDFAEAIIASLQHLDVRIGQSRVIMNGARGRLNFSHDIQEQIQNYNKLIGSGL